MNHSLEDLLDEIQEDEVIEILEDTNELGGFLKTIATSYISDDGFAEVEIQFWVTRLLEKALEIREELVRKKYPLMSNDPRD